MDFSKLNPIPLLREGTTSLLSDCKLSIKRLISLIFTIAILHMLYHVCEDKVPKENQQLFEHCYDGLLLAIFLLTGAATVKDIIALKNGKASTDDGQQPDKQS